jgi:hypothetical protein
MIREGKVIVVQEMAGGSQHVHGGSAAAGQRLRAAAVVVVEEAKRSANMKFRNISNSLPSDRPTTDFHLYFTVLL